jgi:hypothetical protein
MVASRPKRPMVLRPLPTTQPNWQRRVKELESQLKSGQGAEHSLPVDTAANSDRPVNANSPAETVAMVNVGGRWVGPVMLNITQNGASIVTQMADAYGNLLSAGQGTVNGRNLSVQYLNSFYVPGTLTATVSPDGRQMDVTDNGKGFPQYFTFRRQ